MGEAVDAPFKGLNAEDMFFKVLNQRMYIWKSAYEMAAEQGLEGDAFNKFVATFVEDPSDTADAKAKEFALKQTFNNEPGKIAEAIMGITREYPIARFILPFVRVPSNIAGSPWRRLPSRRCFARCGLTSRPAGRPATWPSRRWRSGPP